MFGKIKNYFKESYLELTKVNWPTRSQTINLTIIVILFSLAVAVFLGLLDILFTHLLSFIVL